MKEKVKQIIGIIVLIVLIGVIGLVTYCAIKARTEKVIHPVATFELQDYGTIKMELYPEYAPNTVSNFIALINSGFYNHKIIYGKDDVCLYMARDTDEEAKGPKISTIDNTIEPDSENDYVYEIKGEFVANQFEANTLRHEKGVLSLNRSDYSAYGLTEEGYNSGNYRFSIMMTDSSELNGLYCAFGKVIEGLDVLENINQNIPVTASEEESTIQTFENKPIIANATVETYGVNYDKPEVHEAFDIQSYINELYSQYLSYE